MASLVAGAINAFTWNGIAAARLSAEPLRQMSRQLCSGRGFTLLRGGGVTSTQLNQGTSTQLTQVNPNQLTQVTPTQLTQVRHRYVDWRMLRDQKRRQMVAEYGPRRLRLNAIRKNSIIPKDVQEIADREIHAFPRDSCIGRVHPRCVLTSRPRSVQVRWRLSRIMWRHLADYNQLSGVTRAWW